MEMEGNVINRVSFVLFEMTMEIEASVVRLNSRGDF